MKRRCSLSQRGGRELPASASYHRWVAPLGRLASQARQVRGIQCVFHKHLLVLDIAGAPLPFLLLAPRAPHCAPHLSCLQPGQAHLVL